MSSPSQDPSPVAVSLSREPRGLPTHVFVLFVPSSNSWNDFGYQVHADVGIRSPNQSFEWQRGYLAFKEERSSRTLIQKLLASAKAEWLAADRLSYPFATLLSNVKAYQQVVRQLGPIRAEQTAIAAHDLAFAHARNRPIEGWLDVERSEVFNRAFMRISESAFAYENAGPVFEGLTLDSEDARQGFDATVKLKDASLRYQFRFPDDGFTENRIAVIIGRNGTGKTASLIALGRSLLDKAARGAAIEPRPELNQLLVYAHSRSLRRFKLRSNNPRAAAQQIFSLDPTRTASARSVLTAQLAAMARESSELADPLGLLVDLFSKEFEGLSLWVPVQPSRGGNGISRTDGRYVPLENLWRGSEQARLDSVADIDISRPLLFLGPDRKPRTLSLGQDVFISFTFHAIAKSGPASVFLVDEPENFLHPNLISRFIRLLHGVLERTKSIAIIATHSPYVVREVQRSQVHVLLSGSEAGQIAIEHPRMQTFGASVSSISDDIFGDDIVQHLYVKLLRKAEFMAMPVDTLLERFKTQVSLDALMLLRRMKEQKDKD